MSLSSRRAWIEIESIQQSFNTMVSLSSRRAWIEIDEHWVRFEMMLSRSPHGERGLKFSCIVFELAVLMSLSSRRAWIEIFKSFNTVFNNSHNKYLRYLLCNSFTIYSISYGFRFVKYFSKIFLILFYSFHKEKQALKSECRPPFQNSYNMCNQFYLQYL